MLGSVDASITGGVQPWAGGPGAAPMLGLMLRSSAAAVAAASVVEAGNRMLDR
jgi:hypothetical protein